MNSNDLAELRDRRLRQAEKRGIVRAACALHRAGVRHRGAEWVNESQTIAAEIRFDYGGRLRVWANLGPDNSNNVFGLSPGSVVSVGPSHTPVENIVLEIAFDAAGGADPVLEGYAPGDWETAFLTWVSTEILEVRLRQRRDAITEEGKIAAELLREAARWGGEVPGV